MLLTVIQLVYYVTDGTSASLVRYLRYFRLFSVLLMVLQLVYSVTDGSVVHNFVTVIHYVLLLYLAVE